MFFDILLPREDAAVVAVLPECNIEGERMFALQGDFEYPMPQVRCMFLSISMLNSEVALLTLGLEWNILDLGADSRAFSA